jgi:hypothetical protein
VVQQLTATIAGDVTEFSDIFFYVNVCLGLGAKVSYAIHLLLNKIEYHCCRHDDRAQPMSLSRLLPGVLSHQKQQPPYLPQNQPAHLLN